MNERDACALLKARFEAAGYAIASNVAFDEDGVAFEMDGFDAAKRVGFEYVTEEAGDSWDVDGDVVAALAERREAGDLFVLVIDERDAPDAAAIEAAAAQFLAALPKASAKPAANAKKKTAAKKPAAKKAAKKRPA